MKVLLDTNVIIDAITGREPWNKDAEQIFIFAANQTADIYITATAATDIYYLIRKYFHSTSEAKSIMKKLYTLFGILSVTAEDCINALQSEIDDYEDALVDSIALYYKMNYIVTRNLKDFEKGKTSIISPADFLILLQDV